MRWKLIKTHEMLEITQKMIEIIIIYIEIVLRKIDKCIINL